MTIEESFARMSINLGRIADALDAIAKSQGIVSGELPPDNQTQLDLEPKEEKTTRKDVDKALEKVQKKKKKETVVGKTDDEKPEYTLKDVRARLHKLQEQENQAAVKSVLKKFGASTLGQVDEKKFAQLVTAIEKQLDD